ncbi:DUF202 domain-containing protein [Streptomyces sp. NPDC004647]|uniref:DUF202 domain-containing protein n=1 Tax=Streptomyces sp. NPDC004647 TaxID=3154671 RepID=UPI0033BF4B6C
MERTARDPGLHPERTRLAWRRTTLTFAVAAVLAARQALVGGVSPLAGVGVALVLLAFLVVAHRRIQALTAPEPLAPFARAAPAAAACTVALAVLGATVLM